MYPCTFYVKEVVTGKLAGCPPMGVQLHFLPALLPIQFGWSLPGFAVAKAKRKMNVILKDASGKTLGGNVSNKVFRIKIGSAGMKHKRGWDRRLSQSLFSLKNKGLSG